MAARARCRPNGSSNSSARHRCTAGPSGACCWPRTCSRTAMRRWRASPRKSASRPTPRAAVPSGANTACRSPHGGGARPVSARSGLNAELGLHAQVGRLAVEPGPRVRVVHGMSQLRCMHNPQGAGVFRAGPMCCARGSAHTGTAGCSAAPVRNRAVARRLAVAAPADRPVRDGRGQQRRRVLAPGRATDSCTATPSFHDAHELPRN